MLAIKGLWSKFVHESGLRSRKIALCKGGGSSVYMGLGSTKIGTQKMKPEIPKGILMTTTSTKQGAFKDTRNEVKPRPRTFLRIPNFAPGISYIQKIGNPQLLDAKVEPASMRKYRFHFVCCLKLYSCSGVP